MLKRDIELIKKPLLIVMVYCFFMQIIFGTVCPFKAIFKIPCPACGLTHATFYLFTFRWHKALEYNPTVFLWWISIILFIVDRYIHPLKIKPFPVYFIITSIVTFIWYIYFMLYLF